MTAARICSPITARSRDRLQVAEGRPEGLLRRDAGPEGSGRGEHQAAVRVALLRKAGFGRLFLFWKASIDRRLRHRHAVRGQAPVRERLRQVRRRQPLRPDRRQRLRQVDVHEDPRRRARADAPATVGDRCRTSASASCARTSSPTRTMRVLDVVLMGHAEMWAAMRERDAIYANPGRDRRRLHARGGPRSEVRGVRRLHRRSARRRAAARRRRADRRSTTAR